jgi:hypothetical protein
MGRFREESSRCGAIALDHMNDGLAMGGWRQHFAVLDDGHRMNAFLLWCWRLPISSRLLAHTL